jgi:hypothetical protein
VSLVQRFFVAPIKYYGNTNKQKQIRINQRFYDKYQARELSCDDLVEIIILLHCLISKQLASTLNKLETYSGVERYCKDIKHVNQFKFVKDNE